jgi:hypothetical protein
MFQFLKNWIPKYNGHSACCYSTIYLSILRCNTATVLDISFAQNQVWKYSACVKSPFLIVSHSEFGCLHTKYSRLLSFFYNIVLSPFLFSPNNTVILAQTQIFFKFYFLWIWCIWCIELKYRYICNSACRLKIMQKLNIQSTYVSKLAEFFVHLVWTMYASL